MRINEDTILVGEKVVLVPYRPEHVPKYHAWMQDEELRRLTASEPLSLDEEYEMQQKWSLDDDKLTFIILSNVKESNLCNGETIHVSDPRIGFLPLVGDVNIFLHGTPMASLTKEPQGGQEEDNFFEAEVEIMIAEPAYRRRGLAQEALQLMLSYATGTPNLFNASMIVPSPLRIPATCLVTRITESNNPSIKLFEKLGFKVTKKVDVFKEVEMRWAEDYVIFSR